MKQKLIKQYNEVDCGIFCMQMILSNYSSWVSVETLRDFTDTDTEGTSALGIVNGFAKLGINCEVFKSDNTEWMKKEFKYPVIANIILDNQYLHYCVVYGVKKNKLLIADPAIGKYKISIEDFDKIWTGIILIPEKNPTFQPINYKQKNILSQISFLKSQAWKILSITAVSLLITFFGILSSYYFKFLIDELIPEKNFSNLFIISISYMIGIILTTVFEVVRRYSLEKLGQEVGRDILVRYLDHIYKLPTYFFYKRKTGDIVSRFSDANKIIESLASFTISLVLDLSSIVIVGVILFNINKNLFLITLISLPLYAILILGTNKKMIRLNEEEMEKNATVDSSFIEGLNGIDTIKALCSEGQIINHITKGVNDFFIVSLRRNMGDSIIQNIKILISLLTSIVVLWVGSYYVMEGKITVGALITFNTLSLFFSTPIQNIVKLQEKYQKAEVAKNRLNDVFYINPENSDAHSNTFIVELTVNSTITFKKVCFSYSSKYPNILDDVNISLPLKKNIGIKGDSGSGKSTLAKLLIGFYSPDKGNICIDEKNIKSIDKANLRKLITYVPQEAFIMSGTFKENLVLGLEVVPSEQELKKVLEDACLINFVDNLPLGIDTYLEENGTNLSGGQKQRIALARAMLTKSKVLILDEATSALDSETETVILDNLMIQPNRSIMLITHNVDLINKCDLAIDLNKSS